MASSPTPTPTSTCLLSFACNASTSRKQTQTSSNKSKRTRKVDAKKVVRVRIKSKQGDDEQRKDGPPPDSWTWRKYGQKPIRGSPYPRGYYRCSAEKGCTAKKQVERCKEDDSVLIITYTTAHNHLGPESTTPKNKSQETARKEKAHIDSKQPDQPGNGSHFQYKQSPKHSSPNEDKWLEQLEDLEPYVVTLDSFTPCDSLVNFPMVNKRPKSLKTSRIAEESCDFYDALDELGFSASTPFTSSINNNSSSNNNNNNGFDETTHELPS